MLELAEKDGIRSFVQKEDLLAGREKLNIMFCAQIFNARHGLEKLQEKEIKELPVKVVAQEEEEPEDSDSRELRIYKTWIRSMGL